MALNSWVVAFVECQQHEVSTLARHILMNFGGWDHCSTLRHLSAIFCQLFWNFTCTVKFLTQPKTQAEFLNRVFEILLHFVISVSLTPQSTVPLACPIYIPCHVTLAHSAWALSAHTESLEGAIMEKARLNVESDFVFHFSRIVYSPALVTIPWLLTVVI